jgi:hypothetical protein
MNGMGVDLEKSILKANTDGKGLTIIKNLLLAQDSKAGEFTRNAYDWEDKIFKLAKFYSEMKKNGGMVMPAYDCFANKVVSSTNHEYKITLDCSDNVEGASHIETNTYKKVNEDIIQIMKNKKKITYKPCK